MTPARKRWVDLAERDPESGQFVRVEVREKVHNHWVEFEGQARFDHERGWLTADDKPYLGGEQEIVRWRPLLDAPSADALNQVLGRKRS